MAQRHTKAGGNPYRVGKVHSIRSGFRGHGRAEHYTEPIAQVFAQILTALPSRVYPAEFCVSSSRRYFCRPVLRFQPPRGAPVLVIEENLVSRNDQVFHHAAEMPFRPGQKEEIRANLLPRS